MIRIRKATMKDFGACYSLGLETPELRVTDAEPFMNKKEFAFCIRNKEGVFLVAEENGEILGFDYSSIKERGGVKIACFVYLAVNPKHRNKGVGTLLWKERLKRLKKKGVTYVYAWIGEKNKGMRDYAEKHERLKPGKTFVWYSRRI